MEDEQIIKEYAHVVVGKVVNVSLRGSGLQLAEDEFIIEVPENIPVGIGWSYIDGVFVDDREDNVEIIS